MKIKEKNIESTEGSIKTEKKNGITKKKGKKKENFEVRIPRLIIRNLDFKVRFFFVMMISESFRLGQRRTFKKDF